jgi:adenine-specific DNA-methyltransferase
MAKKKSSGNASNGLKVETLTHKESTRKNLPTAEYQSVMEKREQSAVRVAYERRNRDLDPQLVWRGKDEQDWSDLVVHAPPLYIQEKVHPKALIDDLKGRTKEREFGSGQLTMDMFADFNGIPKGADKTEFYRHDQNWSNRMILGDSLQVMASLAEREGLRGQVQCIYFDPPYGIKFNSNFQWSTLTRDVKDGNTEHITREPEQVKAFRDTWRDGIHSYLTYLRDRLTVARDLLSESGSIFVQIGEENLHLVRSLLDEVFGSSNFFAQISFVKAGALGATGLPRRLDYILWFAKSGEHAKFRKALIEKTTDDLGQYTQVVQDDYSLRPLSKEEKLNSATLPVDKLCRLVSFTKPGPGARYDLQFEGDVFTPGRRWWGFPEDSTKRIIKAGRIRRQGNSVASLRYWNDYAVEELSNLWTDTASGSGMEKVYVVQTNEKVIQRCILMATDPGDLVLDPTCGSGTTAYVSEQWGRRWITIDTSRVALALARSRIMGARYPFYLLADSKEGQLKEAEVTRTAPSSQPTYGRLRHGFVYERVPHITLKSIAYNAEIDVIWEKYEAILRPLIDKFNSTLKNRWEEWEIPRDLDNSWPDALKKAHKDFWAARIARQKEMDASIAAKAEFEYLYDKPFVDKSTVRVAGPFTVESLSPHRVLGVDENDNLISKTLAAPSDSSDAESFVQMILENLKTAGVQQAHRQDKISFTSLEPWPGDLICGVGKYTEGNKEKRAAIFIGPEFGTVSRPDLVAAAREAGDADFDVLITCAFNYDAHSSEFDKLGRIPVLKARMNADLHMADDLKNTGKGNLFVIFGEPDIEIKTLKDGQIQVKVKGVDVFDPSSGEVRSDGPEGIACWFIDTDYNEESFFVRHAYFLGANDPYKALKTTLKAEIDEEAWASLNSDTSRPFEKPKSGRIAVKVINHLGDEVMKVFKVT